MKLEDFMNKYGNVNVEEKELKELLGVTVEKYFYPKEDEKYYTVNRKGEVVKNYNDNPRVTSLHFENNELFRTKEEAEEHAKKQRFLLQMKRDFLDNTDRIDWYDDYQTKYHFVYHYGKDTILITKNWYQKKVAFMTTNREWLEEYITKYEGEIKKYYFESEEVL